MAEVIKEFGRLSFVSQVLWVVVVYLVVESLVVSQVLWVVVVYLVVKSLVECCRAYYRHKSEK